MSRDLWLVANYRWSKFEDPISKLGVITAQSNTFRQIQIGGRLVF